MKNISLLIGIFFLSGLALWARDEGDSAVADPSSSAAGEAPLFGMFYDFKQDPLHKPTNINPDVYGDILNEFFAKGFDESVLNRYYRPTKPIRTTHIYLRMMSSDVAPKAFGVDAWVKPASWIAYYKGQVVPPSDGVYRFVGYSDDLIIVGVDHKVVLNGSRTDCTRLMPDLGWNGQQENGAPAANGKLTNGDWFEAKTSQPIDIDILIGDRPGGQFAAFLLIEKQGDTYQQRNGFPVLPVFQVAPYNGKFEEGGGTPVIAAAHPWKCLQ